MVDCLIEQTHPELQAKEDRDVSWDSDIPAACFLSFANVLFLLQLRYTDMLFTEQEVGITSFVDHGSDVWHIARRCV